MVGIVESDKETGEMMDPKCREKDTLKAEFWEPIFAETDFQRIYSEAIYDWT